MSALTVTRISLSGGIGGTASDLGLAVSVLEATEGAAEPETRLPVLTWEHAEARLSEDLDAAEAGYRIGYDDPSHFSREYKRHFGEPPMRDVERLRELAPA
jgi:AraC-like DNA-binding protein